MMMPSISFGGWLSLGTGGIEPLFKPAASLAALKSACLFFGHATFIFTGLIIGFI